MSNLHSTHFSTSSKQAKCRVSPDGTHFSNSDRKTTPPYKLLRGILPDCPPPNLSSQADTSSLIARSIEAETVWQLLLEIHRQERSEREVNDLLWP